MFLHPLHPGLQYQNYAKLAEIVKITEISTTPMTYKNLGEFVFSMT